MMMEQLHVVEPRREASFASRLNASSAACRVANNPSRRGDAGVIFIVDDDPCVAELYTLFLEPEGFCLRFFRDRAAALHALESAERAPEVVITDYLGHALEFETFVGRVRESSSSRVLLISGLPCVARQFPGDGLLSFLPKPFTREELLREVNRTALRAV
jgi:DNA-binding NtrC family response regulator